MNLENLKTMDKKELRVLAAQHGIHAHHAAKAETIANLIIEKVLATTPQPQAQQNVVAPKLETVATLVTEEQVLERCASAVNKGVKLSFAEDCWQATYKGAEDSGHMSMPINLIARRVSDVARGAFLLVKRNDFGDIAVNQPYAGQVMAGG